MFAILEDDGSTCLKVWIVKSPRRVTININASDIRIENSKAKKVALAMLTRYPAKVLYIEHRRGARLLVAVKVRKSTCKALEVLSRAEGITAKKAKEMIENPASRLILKLLHRGNEKSQSY
jgi:hypothetical protein